MHASPLNVAGRASSHIRQRTERKPGRGDCRKNRQRECDEGVGPRRPAVAPSGTVRCGQLRGGLPLGDRVEIGIRCCTAAASLEHRALLDGKGHVVDIALHPGGGLQGHFSGADHPGNGTPYHHFLPHHHATDLALLADDDFDRLDIALDLAVDLQDAPPDDLETLADDLQVIADDRPITFLHRRGVDGPVRMDRARLG